MASSKSKARNFAFILYPESIPTNWEECLTKIGVSMAVSPIHDKDVSEKEYEDMTDEEKEIVDNGGTLFKKAHYHVIYIAHNPVTVESVRKKLKRALGDKSVSHIEIVDNVQYYFNYLTHETKDAIRKKKYKYDKKDIVYINDFDIDRYVKLDESQKRILKNRLLELAETNHLVNYTDLMAYVRVHADELHLGSIYDVVDVVTMNSGGFRLVFDANYQNGWRPKYADYIDADTGEIKKGLGSVERV